MIEALKSLIIIVCSAVIFITAVEMILPHNSIKKYAKFVLGVVLIAAIIDAFFGKVNINFNLASYINNISYCFDSKSQKANEKEYKNKSLENTKMLFKQNLEKVCLSKLKDKYPKDKYKVEVKLSYLDDKGFNIDGLNIYTNGIKIKKIQKVNLKESGNNSEELNILNGEKADSIKEMLSRELKVSPNIIKVYKL